MKPIKLSGEDVEYFKLLIEKDIVHAAKDISFFEEMKIEPKEYIDEMILMANKFRLDFWKIIKISCSDTELKRLEALYENMAPGGLKAEHKKPASKK